VGFTSSNLFSCNQAPLGASGETRFDWFSYSLGAALPPAFSGASPAPRTSARTRGQSGPAADLTLLRDVGEVASWSVSSSKPGFGVEHLSDPNTRTLWQSEGPQPHLINIQFPRKQSISQVSIYADVNLDDSYTPQKISLRAGTYHGDLHEVRYIEMTQPQGWMHFKLSGRVSDAEGEEDDPIRAHLLQICIISNHLNGKDSHVRGVRIFAPRQTAFDEDGLMPFTTTAFRQHETIR